jgi:hypothetical protein
MFIFYFQIPVTKTDNYIDALLLASFRGKKCVDIIMKLQSLQICQFNITPELCCRISFHITVNNILPVKCEK